MSVSKDPLVPKAKVDRRKGTRSEEYKRKMKQSYENRKNDPVKYDLFRERLSKGIKRAWENRENNGYGSMSQSIKRAWENRENNGYGSRFTVPFSEETRNKMSEAKKEQWRKIKETLKQYGDKGGSK
jgi:hypothetical protein